MSVVVTSPDQAEGVVAEAEALLAAGQAAAALVLLASATPHQRGDARILTLQGRALLALGAHAAGFGALLAALDCHQDKAVAHATLAEAHLDGGDLAQALAHSLEAFELTPDAGRANDVARALLIQGRFAAALGFADQALRLRPDHAAALANRAVALQGMQQYAEAIESAQRSLALSPSDPVGRHNLAMMLLRLGQWTTHAWTLFEARLLLKGKPAVLSGPNRWTGEAMPGRTLLLLAEQGLGDTLQFARYAPLTGRRAGRVILAVQPPLVRLLRGLPGVDDVVSAEEPLPAHDRFCPLLSLPGIFRTTLQNIPPPLLAERAPKPRERGAGLRVGLVWAGSPGFVRDDQRSIAPGDLAALAGVAGVQFYSLQRREPGRAGLPEALEMVDLMAGVTDFADTAAQVAALDLVISVDTSVAHLAATMGKPVWLLSRHVGCWRWLHDRVDSPWYPALRIFRQTAPGGWDAVIAQVRLELVALAS